MANHERDKIVEILCESFDDNQSVNFVVKQDRKRAKRMKTLMKYSYFYGSAFGEVKLLEDDQACVITIDPSKKKTTLSSIIWDIRLVFGCMGLGLLPKVLKRQKILDKYHPKEDFIHLWYIGLKNDLQGQGIGSKLMKELIDRYDKQGLPIFLETSTVRNFPFYERLGFEVLKESDEFGYTMRMYMRRP